MSNITGRLQKVAEKGGIYSVKVNDVWFGCFKTKPSGNEGDLVSFNFTTKGEYKNADMKSFKVTEKASDEPKVSSVTSSVKSQGSSWGKDQTIISKQAARNSAITWVTSLLTAGALVLPKTQKDQLSVLDEYLDHYTDTFFNYSQGIANTPEASEAATTETNNDEEWKD